MTRLNEIKRYLSIALFFLSLFWIRAHVCSYRDTAPKWIQIIQFDKTVNWSSKNGRPIGRPFTKQYAMKWKQMCNWMPKRTLIQTINNSLSFSSSSRIQWATMFSTNCDYRRMNNKQCDWLIAKVFSINLLRVFFPFFLLSFHSHVIFNVFKKTWKDWLKLLTMRRNNKQ